MRLLATIVVALALLGGTANAAEPFDAPNSVWNARLPVAPRPQASDGSIRAAFLSAANGTNWVATDSYSTPIYRPGALVAKHPIVLDSWRAGTPMQAWLNLGVPYKSSWQPAAGSDGHITIYQRSTHKLWSCWAASNQGGVLHAQTCQGTDDTRTDPGYSVGDRFTWTSTATGLPVVAGTMTLSQLKAHVIGHALALDTNNVCGSYYSWPAQQHDGGSATGSCVPEGTKVYFGAGTNCALPLAIQRDICAALRDYGGIVRDSTVTGIGLFAEDVTAKGLPDPYYANENLFQSTYPNSFLSPANFPWSALKVLPLHVCTNQGIPCQP